MRVDTLHSPSGAMLHSYATMSKILIQPGTTTDVDAFCVKITRIYALMEFCKMHLGTGKIGIILLPILDW